MFVSHILNSTNSFEQKEIQRLWTNKPTDSLTYHINRLRFLCHQTSAFKGVQPPERSSHGWLRSAEDELKPLNFGLATA